MPPRTGEIIVARGLATAAQVEKAALEAAARGEPLLSRLLAIVDEARLAEILGERYGVPGVDLSRSVLSLSLLDLVPRAVAEGDLILPLSEEGGRVHLAMARPLDDRILAEVRFVTGREVSPYVAVRAALLRAVGEAYAARARGAEVWAGARAEGTAPHLASSAGEEEVVPLEGELIPELIPDAEEEDGGIVIEVETGPATPAPREGSSPLVLVVDDEPEIRQLVQRMLVAKGYAVELAVDGQEALDKAEALVPDLVLLDAMLPKVHGFDACRRIKASARTRHVPVIMMTAIYRGWRFAQDARDSYGAQDYVEKPFRMEDLLQRMEAALLAAPAAAAPAPAPAAAPQGAALVARARELLGAGKAADALPVLEEAVRKDPRSADAQYQLGRALLATGEQFGAMTALERAVEARPGHVPALRALAGLYEDCGFRRKAAEILERALPHARDAATLAAIKKDLLRFRAA